MPQEQFVIASINESENEYLPQGASRYCKVEEVLATRRARRTFASTVTLSNEVSIYIVKEMPGHYSIKQQKSMQLQSSGR